MGEFLSLIRLSKAEVGKETFLKVGFKSLELERTMEIAGQPLIRLEAIAR
jgi:hypothetical protein